MYEPIELTKKLIEMRSCTRENANQAVRIVGEIFKEVGLKHEILDNHGHLMLVACAGKGDKTLVLNGHLDVVPGYESQYIPTIRSGRLYGRGSYDMLGACAVMINLMCDLAVKPPEINVILMLSSTEETNGAICTKYMLEQGYVGDFAICGEPTNFKISVMSKGVFRIKIRVNGKAAHGSRPWLGDNAILNAVRIFERITQLPFVTRKNKYFDGASVNLSRLEGGDVINQVPDRAEMTLDIRFVPGEKVESILEQIQSIEGDFSVEVIGHGAAVEVSEENYYLKILEEVTKRHNAGIAGDSLTAQHGAADTMFFQEMGIPSVEFGLTGAGHHGKEEHVTLDSFLTYKYILVDVIEEMTKCT